MQISAVMHTGCSKMLKSSCTNLNSDVQISLQTLYVAAGNNQGV